MCPIKKIMGIVTSRFSAILFLLVAINPWVCTLSSYQLCQGISQPYEVSTTYVEHPTIYIDGNNDFISQASAEAWPGDGTKHNPYIISDYDIVGNGSGSLIYIRNINIHYQIRDCRLNNGYYGIHLYRVTNGDVSSNEVTNNVEGVSLVYSQNIRVKNNIITDNTWGVLLYLSGNNTVTTNSISNNDYGIYLSSSGSNNITSNSFVNGGLYISGFGFEDFIQTEVSDNTVNGDPIVFWQNFSGGTIPVGAGQIFLINCTSIEVKNQDLEGLSVGLVTAFSSDISIHDNSIYNNIRGAYLRLSKNITVINNFFGNNERGLFLSDTGNNTILNNIFVKDGLYVYGGQFEGTLQANVSNNIVNGKPLVFWQGIDEGVVPMGAGQVILIDCSSIEVKDQKLDKSAVGLISHYCNDLDVRNNSMNNNFWGIYMENTNNSNFIHNLISNNSQDGVYLEDSCNNYFIFNHFRNNAENRHVFDYGSNNTFVYNYWSGWTIPDNNRDDIVDNSYKIPSSSDSYDVSPLVSPNTHLLLPPKINYPKGVGILSGIVTISWTAALDSLGHKITYAVFYSLDGNTWISLSSGLTNTTYKWDTRNLETDESIYVIKIRATCSEGFTVEVVSGYKSTYENGTFQNVIIIIFTVLGLFLLSYFVFYRNKQREPSIIQKRFTQQQSELDKVVIPCERTEPSITQPDIEKSEDFVPVSVPSTATSQVTLPVSGMKSEDDEKKALFSSVQYRVKDIIYEPTETGLVVRLIPYSGTIKEIRVEFNDKQIIMSGHLIRNNLPKVTLELKSHGEPRGPSWGDPWQEISMKGDKDVIAGIKIRSEIPNSLNSLGSALVEIMSPREGEIYIKITCNEIDEAVKQAYSLITALQSFFEISYY
ncbi:MAG: nitrous oxide reductase family maturation protein NosD [Candidatus Hodarchaeota archaeon]